MRRYQRSALSPTLMTQLSEWTREIRRRRKLETRRIQAQKSWRKRKRTAAFREVCEALVAMNAGLPHCMYCEADRGAVKKGGQQRAIVEHWMPRHLDPLGTFDWNNLFLSCGICNSFLKGDAFPVDALGNPRLLNPVRDDPVSALVFSPSTGAYTAAPGSQGEVTIDFFHLDQLDRSRRGICHAYAGFLVEYDEAVQAGDLARVAQVREEILTQPFRGVLIRLCDMARDPATAVLLDRNPGQALRIAALINAHEVWKWL